MKYDTIRFAGQDTSFDTSYLLCLMEGRWVPIHNADQGVGTISRRGTGIWPVCKGRENGQHAHTTTVFR